MADTIKFQCDLNTTNLVIPLGFEVLLDGKSMFKTEHVMGPCQVAFDITDDEATHRLQFVMTGKTADHTKIDEQGNITSDAVLKISNILVDDILIDTLLNNMIDYTHDFNGTKNTTTDKFYGTMGCNGTATFEFTTPFYLWLLENM
jgi:uncharacterized protein (UPF0371 family)